MIIDPRDWIEYRSDDPECGKPPFGVELEFLQVITLSCVEAQQKDIGPWRWRKLPGNESECKNYWRLKDDS